MESGDITEFLEYVIVSDCHDADQEESEKCREAMTKYFPDPVSRARIYKRLALSASNEEPNEDDEGAVASEVDFFMNEMLEAIAQAFEASIDLTACKEIIKKIQGEE